MVLTFTGSYFIQLFFNDSHSSISNIICSEGLSYPLYFLFFKYLLDTLFTHRKSSWAITWIFAFLLTCVREQLTWTLLLCCGTGPKVFSDRSRRSRAGAWAVSLLIAILIFFSTTQISVATNRMHHGLNTHNSMGRSVILATAAYCSSPQDAKAFPELSVERTVFLAINEHIEETRSGERFAPEGLYQRFAYYSAHYDTLKDHLSSVMEDAGIPADDSGIYYSIAATLAVRNVKTLFRHVLLNFYAGMIRSITDFRRYLTAAAAILYCIALGWLAIFSRYKTMVWERTLLGTALIASVINAAFVAFGVFALSRYMFYNLPILYVSGEICFFRTIALWQEHRNLQHQGPDETA